MSTGHAWCAGFYEGEGTVGEVKYPGRSSIRIQVRRNSKDGSVPEVLERWQRTIGEGVIYGPYYHGKSASFSLNVTGFPAVTRVLRKLWPYLGHVKREQAIEAFRKCGRRFWNLPG